MCCIDLYADDARGQLLAVRENGTDVMEVFMKKIGVFMFLFLFGMNNALNAESFKGLAFRFSKFLGGDLLEVVLINLDSKEDFQLGATNGAVLCASQHQGTASDSFHGLEDKTRKGDKIHTLAFSEEDTQLGVISEAELLLQDVVERKVLRELKLVDRTQSQGEFNTQDLRIRWERQLYFVYGKHFNLVYETDASNRVELVGDIVNTNGVYACHFKYSQIQTKNGRDYVFGYCGSVNSERRGDYELKCGRWGH